jgi:transcriptional regulator with XRE-family HTH domain
MMTTEESATSLGRWITDSMESRGLNQSDLARISGMGQSTISSWISGTRSPRKIEDLEPLVKALHLGASDTEEYEAFYASAIRAAWPSPPTKDEVRAQKALPIAEAYWNLQARDKSIVDSILYTNAVTGEVMTMDDINKILDDDAKQ